MACRRRRAAGPSAVSRRWTRPSSGRLQARAARRATAAGAGQAPAADSLHPSLARAPVHPAARRSISFAQPRRARWRYGCDMYRSDLDGRDKSGAIAAVAAIHAGLLFAFLHLSGRIDLADPQSVLQVFDLAPESRRRRRRRRRRAQRNAEAQGEGRRLVAEEHQERGDSGRRAQAADRDSAGQPIPVDRNAAPGRRADPGRVERRRPGHGRGRDRDRHRQRRSGAAGRAAAASGLAVIRTRLADPAAARPRFPPRAARRLAARRARSSCASGSMPNGCVIQCIVDRGTGNRGDRF